MARNTTWNGIGTSIREASSIDEALKISNLDYEVVKVPVYLSTGYKIPDTYATKKKGTNDTFGIVGKDFTIVQNKDAFSFVDSIIPEGLTFEKAGETSWMNYIIASLPSQYVLNDEMKPYIIFQNSHAGTSTLRAAICPLRIVCSNQFSMAFRGAENKVVLRHTSSVIDRLNAAKDVMSLTASYMSRFSAKAEKMAMIKVSDDQVKKVVDQYFVIDEAASTRKINSMEDKRTLFLNAYNVEDNQNFKGTAWGMVNAFSDYITHVEPGRSTDKAKISKFTSVTLNTGLMDNFLNILMANV